MKKHFWGFALFTLIVASFVLVYAFFSAPSLPSKEAVKPPVSQTETRVEKPYSCRFRKNKLSYEFQSSEFYMDERQIVSKIKILWNGFAEPPKKVYVTSNYFTLENRSKNSFGSLQILEEPFRESNEKVFTIITSVSPDKKIDGSMNLYADFEVEDKINDGYGGGGTSLADIHQVLFVHGTDSFYKPGSVQRGRFIPNK